MVLLMKVVIEKLDYIATGKKNCQGGCRFFLGNSPEFLKSSLSFEAVVFAGRGIWGKKDILGQPLVTL
jgi:hypothetical protein